MKNARIRECVKFVNGVENSKKYVIEVKILFFWVTVSLVNSVRSVYDTLEDAKKNIKYFDNSTYEKVKFIKRVVG